MAREKTNHKRNLDNYYYFNRGKSVRENYRLGTEMAREQADKERGGAYFPAAGYKERRQGSLKTDYSTYETPRGDIIRDKGFADQLIREAADVNHDRNTHPDREKDPRNDNRQYYSRRRGVGQDTRLILKDAIEIYNMAIIGAEKIGDYELARKIYQTAKRRIESSEKRLEAAKIEADEKIKRGEQYIGRHPMLNLHSLKAVKNDLINPDERRKSRNLESYAMAILGIGSLILIFLIFATPTGGVVGAPSVDVMGLFAFLFGVIAAYLYLGSHKRRRRKRRLIVETP
ncbi:MAG: hypothetical protein WC867_06185 [Candidatus Pacearchaeota archaeon]